MNISKKIIFRGLFSFFLLSPFSISSQTMDGNLVKDLTPEQIALAQAALNGDAKEKVNDDPKDNAETLIPQEINQTKKKINDINDRIKLQQLETDIKSNKDLTDSQKVFLIDNKINNKYGYDFFNKIPSSISAVGDLPLPADYKISLSDEFSIILSGSENNIFDLEVKLDGTILFPELGSISVVGETFGEIKTKLTNIINQSYIGVNVDISLKNLSAKKITITGAVKSPGTYLVNPFSTITSALYYSGGILEYGSLRNIKLLKTNGKIYSFDLYELLIYGNRSNDTIIDAGDVIFIEPAGSFVDLKGSIKRPALYELVNNDTLKNLIDYGLGFSDKANKNKISVSKLNYDRSIIDQIETSNLDYLLTDVITVDIYDYKSDYNAGILVSGAVREAGFYNLDDHKTLDELINKLDLVNVYPYLAILEQFDKQNLLSSSVFFNLNYPSSYNSIKLLPNAKVYFLETKNPEAYKVILEADPIDITDESEYLQEAGIDNLISAYDFLKISEQTKKKIADYFLTVNHQGDIYKMPVSGYFTIKNFVDYLGLDMTTVDNESSTYINPIDDFVSVGNYKNMNFVTKKFHNISFRSLSNRLLSVRITGEVKFGGNYTINNGTTLLDLYELAGGFSDIANLEGIVLQRQSVIDLQVNAIAKAQKELTMALLSANKTDRDIDPAIFEAVNADIDPDLLGRISGNYTPSNPEIKDFILNDLDVIYIPKLSKTISVIGEVLNPNTFTYTDSISINDAITYAGGFKNLADKNGIYIIHANGLISSTERNLFIKKRIDLMPGDTIIIPAKIYKDSVSTVAAISSVISNLAFSAAALQSLQTN